MTGEIVGISLLQVAVQFYDALGVARKVVRSREGDRFHVDPFVDRAGVVQILGVGVVVEQGVAPARTMDIIDAGKATEPVKVTRRIAIQKVIPTGPESLGKPVNTV